MERRRFKGYDFFRKSGTNLNSIFTNSLKVVCYNFAGNKGKELITGLAKAFYRPSRPMK